MHALSGSQQCAVHDIHDLLTHCSDADPPRCGVLSCSQMWMCCVIDTKFHVWDTNPDDAHASLKRTLGDVAYTNISNSNSAAVARHTAVFHTLACAVHIQQDSIPQADDEPFVSCLKPPSSWPAMVADLLRTRDTHGQLHEDLHSTWVKALQSAQFRALRKMLKPV